MGVKPLFPCDPERFCALHDCHEHADGHHRYDWPRTDTDSDDYDPGHRLCVCGAIDADDFPWCFCGHGRDSHNVNVALGDSPRFGCVGCAFDAMGFPADPAGAEPVHEFVVVIDGRGRDHPAERVARGSDQR